MVHWYVWYNGHGFTIRVSFMVNVYVCACVEGGGLWIQWFHDQCCSHFQWMVTIE
jgi:hypothetical protein